MVDAALRAAGHRSARYTSPHLVDLDRAVRRSTAGPVDADALRGRGRRRARRRSSAARRRRAAGAADVLRGDDGRRVRAVPARAASRSRCSRSASAAGSTRPTSSRRWPTAITSIAFDHEQYLGHDARARSPSRRPASSSPACRSSSATSRRRRATRSRGSRASAARRSSRARDGVDRRDAGAAGDVRLRTPARDYGDVALALRGAHQVGNAVVAVRLLETLDARGVAGAAGGDRRAASRTVSWPGRLDLRRLPDGRELLLDAAHNPAGAAALASYLDERRRGRPPLVFAAMRDKDVARHASRAAAGRRRAGRHARVEPALGRSGRARRPRARRSRRRCRSTVAPSPRDALAAAWRDVAAHRRRRIDLSARRRHEGDRAVVIPFETTPASTDAQRFCSASCCAAAPLAARRRRTAARAAALRRLRQRRSATARGRIGEKHWQLIGQRRDRARRHEDLRRRRRGLHATRTARSRPATSSSRRATTASRPTAPTSTPRRASAPSTTRPASPPSSRRGSAPRPGAVAPPPVAGQETDVYFFGETVEKIGPKKYKITNGGFTTCVQPTPRWDLHADTVVLNIDHYTLLQQRRAAASRACRCSTCPILYYPTKKEDRATGFLHPDLRLVDAARPVASQRVLLGDRPQPGRDVPARLVLEDRPGRRRRVPLQLRRRLGRQHPRTYLLDQHEADATRRRTARRRRCRPAAATRCAAARTSCCPAACARARASTTSRASTTMQTFNTNIYDASRNQRTLRRQRRRRLGHLLAERARSTTASTSTARRARHVTGSWPRVCARAQRAAAVRARRSTSRSAASTPACCSDSDRTTRTARRSTQGLTRLDFTPQIRFPFKKWQWFTVNSTARLARHVLHAQPRSDATDPTASRSSTTSAEPAVLHAAGADRRARSSTGSGTRRTTATPRSSSTRSSRS